MKEKIKAHIEKYKIVYSCIGTAVVTAGITTIIMRDRCVVLQTGANGPDVATTRSLMRELHAKLDAGMDWPERAPVDSLFISGRSLFGSVTNNPVITVHKGTKGNPGFITRCVETGELFATQSDAARAFNIPEEFLSKHLNYGRELAENIHFERVGILT